MNKVKVKLLVPTGLLFDGEVSSLTVPAWDGQVEILNEHAEYAGILGIGFLFLGSNKPSWLVSGGVFSVKENEAHIVADKVIDVESPSAQILVESYQMLESELGRSQGLSDEEWLELCTKVRESASFLWFQKK